MEASPKPNNGLKDVYVRVIEEGLTSYLKQGAIPQKFADKVLAEAKSTEAEFSDNGVAVTAGHDFLEEVEKTVDTLRKINKAQMDLMVTLGRIEERTQELKQNTSPNQEPWTTKELVRLTEQARIINRQLEALENRRSELTN